MTENEFIASILESELPANARFVAIVLLRFRNRKTGKCYPSLETIAASCGLCRNAVSAAVEQLEKNGYISIKKMRPRYSKSTCNFYSFQFDCSPDEQSNERSNEQSDDCSNDQSNDCSPDEHKPIEPIEPSHSLEKPDATCEDSDPVKIIQAFDDAIAETWGENRRRPYPNAIDCLTAKDWLAAGYSVEFCRKHFREHMAKMLAKGKQPPGMLKFFEKSLSEAFAREKKANEFSDNETDHWRARAGAWNLNKTWLGGWGPSPDKPGCKCPVDVLKQFGLNNLGEAA